MTTHPFVDPAALPDETALTAVLGKARPHWDALLAYLDEECSGVRREWKFYGAKYGWQLKAARRKGAVLYLVPRRGSFLAALALKGRALEAVRASRLPPALIREIEGAKEYAEGKPARVEVKGKAQVEVVKQLVAFKLAT
jgi:uncharacterized protein DUF3788